MGMFRGKQVSNGDPKLLAQVIDGPINKTSTKREANWEGRIAAKKRKRKHQRTDDGHPRQSITDLSDDELLRRSPHSDPKILPGESGRSFDSGPLNDLVSDDGHPRLSSRKNIHSDPTVLPGESGRSFDSGPSNDLVFDDGHLRLSSGRNPHSDPTILPGESERSFDSGPSNDLISNDGHPRQSSTDNELSRIGSRKRSESGPSSDSSDELSRLPSRGNPHSDPTILGNRNEGSSETCSLIDLTSFRDLEQSIQVSHETDHLLQDQPNSSKNSNVSSRNRTDITPSYVFRDPWYSIYNDEAEDIPYEWRTLQPYLPMDKPSEDQHIRNFFKEECKSEDSTSQTESLNVHQTEVKDVFESSDQGNQNCYDWDKFLERWEGMQLTSDSTLEAQHYVHMTLDKLEISENSTLGAQHQEHKTLDESEVSESSPSTGTKRKKSASNSSIPFNGQNKKKIRIADSPELLCKSAQSKSSSSEEEQGSNRKFVLSSFEKEMEMVVCPVSSNTSESNADSKLEKFIKNTKIKLSENDEKPSFKEKFVKYLECDSPSPPNGTNGSFLFNDSNFPQVDAKAIFNLFKNQIEGEENILGGTNNSTDKNEELTDSPVFEDEDANMIS